MFEFKMPKLGADMDEGILLEWKIAPRDFVKKRDIVAVVETSKGAIEIETFVDAEVESLAVKPGAIVPVGTVMAHFRVSGTQAIKSPVIDSVTQTPPATADPLPATAGLPVSPRARRLAQQLQVDLANVQGTGPEGSIVAADVQAVAARTPAAARTQYSATAVRTARKAVDLRTAIRNTVAAAMSRSKREIPHYYLAQDIDVSTLLSFVESWNQAHSVADRILPALLYYKSIGIAAREFQPMNGLFANGEFQPAAAVNLGVAISLRSGGLMAPCLIDMAGKPAVELMRELKDLVLRTRKGGLRASELSMGTITVSNLGDHGVDFLAGVIYPPQVALVGIGSMRERAWVVEGALQVRRIVNFSLAADHRASDGHTGALFLRRIEELMESPEKLMQEH